MSTRRSGPRAGRSVTGNASRLDLLVFVEGLRTEEQYLLAWHRLFRDTVNVEIGARRGAPLTIVKAAVDAKKREAMEERKGRGRAHDQYWCMFDRDEHPNLPQAFDLAKAHDIRIAHSDPCLELWFLLHFRDQAAALHRHEAQRVSREYLRCDKVLDQSAASVLIERYEDAKKRAIRLEEKHSGDGSPAMANPGSSVWRLVDEIKGSRGRPAGRGGDRG